MKGGSKASVLRSIQTLFDSGSATGMTDRELVERFLRGGAKGQRRHSQRSCARHGPMVWNVCRNIASDAHAAEDAFQATFLILVRKARSIRRCETLGPWLHGVARRVAVRAKATLARRQAQEERGAEMKAKSRPDQTRFDEIEALHQEIGRLPEKYRAAVVLCHLEGCTHAEAARVLKCPTGTVNVRVSRARQLLRDRLARRGVAFATIPVGPAFLSDPATAAMPMGLAESTTKAAMQVAAGNALTAGAVSATVSQLTRGALRTMTLKKISLAAAVILATGSVSSGIALVAMGGKVVKGNAAEPSQESAQEKGESEQEVLRKERELGLSRTCGASRWACTAWRQRPKGAALRQRRFDGMASLF